MSYIERFKELYDRFGAKNEIFEGILWIEYNKMVVPVGPIKYNYSISDDKSYKLLSRFPNALMVRSSDGFKDERHCYEWYAVVCDEFLEIDQLEYEYRKQIRKGVKNFTVERIDAAFFAEHGYSVFVSAFEKYRSVAKPTITESEFKKKFLSTKDLDDIVHYWGVFYQNNLVAYAVIYIYDHIQFDYCSTKAHPDFLRLRSYESMFYTINKYYLKENKFEIAVSGFRNLLHQTSIQDYLIKKFGFKKVYANLHIIYKPYLSLYFKLTFPMRRVVERVNPKLAALYKQEEIRRACRSSY